MDELAMYLDVNVPWCGVKWKWGGVGGSGLGGSPAGGGLAGCDEGDDDGGGGRSAATGQGGSEFAGLVEAEPGAAERGTEEGDAATAQIDI